MIRELGDRPHRDKVRSGAAVVAVHAVLGLVLVNGLDVGLADRATTPMSVYDIPPQSFPPPPEPVEPAQEPSEAAQGGEPSPVIAPQTSAAPLPPTRLRSLATTPALPAAAKPESTGSDDGTSARAGPSGGGGGLGQGGGDASGAGDGGGGGAVTGARKLGGRLVDSDYPRAARQAGAEGTVFVRFTVERDGRVRGCAVTQSSGHSELDATTCRLIERRFRYAPARDAQGQPIAVEVVGRQNWWIPRNRGESAGRSPSNIDNAVDGADRAPSSPVR